MTRISPPPIESEEASELYVDEVLDGSGSFQYLDKVGSVSGLEQERNSLVWDEMVIDHQYRRFLHGS